MDGAKEQGPPDDGAGGDALGLGASAPAVQPDESQLTEAQSPHDIPPTPADSASSSTLTDIDREVADAMASMDAADLAELTGQGSAEPLVTSDSVEPGTELVGTIVGTGHDEIFLEFGAKLQGILPRHQIQDGESVEAGCRFSVVVERYDAEAGMVITRRPGCVQRASWTTLELGMLVEGRVTGLIKGGLEVDLQGIRGFMPGSQVSLTAMRDISVLLNERVRCEVIEVNRRKKNVLLSRRKVMEHERAQSAEKLKGELAVGQTRSGTVTNLTDFGAFVDLGGLEGLIHIRDVSWATIGKVSDVLSPGQEVEVKILKIDAKRDRISLGLKQAQPDPWVPVPERYPVGTTLKTRIIRNTNFGSFAELEPGVEGLIPIGEMAWNRIANASEVVSPGDMVDAVVIRLDMGKRRLALSMKQAQPDPWDGVLEDFAVQSLVKGRVTRLADFGVFVELIPGVEGLIHISELSDRRVRSCTDVVSIGQVVEARVLGVSQDDRRISLSLKQVASPAPTDNAHTPTNGEPAKPLKKRKKKLRGGLSSHFDW